MKNPAMAALLTLSLALCGCSNSDRLLTEWAISVEQKLAGVETKQIMVGDFLVPYLEGGQGDTVLLIHGFQSNKGVWLRLARHLTQHYHVIAIDLPAHGQSNILMDKSYTIPEQAKRVIVIMGKLGLTQPVHVVGHSMGGAIAFHVAAMAPGHVKSLALLSSAGVESPKPSELSKLRQRGQNPLIIRNEKDYRTLMAFSMAQPPYIPEIIVSALTKQAVEHGVIAEKIFREIQLPSSLPVEQTLPRIQAPTLVLWGDQDRLLDVSSTEVFKRLLPKSQVVILPGVGHVPQVERTKETAEIYQTFLRRVKS